jgi:peptidoglycan/LPS O-acetylase OafA/YrhL
VKVVLLGIALAGPAVRLVESLIVGFPPAPLFHERFDLVVYVLPFSHIDAFALGGYLALFGRAGRPLWLGLYAAVVIILGLATEQFASGGERLTFGYGPFMADSWKHVWAYSCLSLLFGWLLLLIRERRVLPGLMEHPALVALGRISYGLYVYHFAAIWASSLVDVSRLPGPSILWRIVIAAATLLGTMLISAASYRLLEQPCLRLKDRFFPRRPAAFNHAEAEVVAADGPSLQIT